MSERTVSSARAEEDAAEATLRPQTLADFTGQKASRENLAIFIEAARHRGEARTLTDIAYPFDFTLPVAGDAPLEFWFETQSASGAVETSPVGRLLLR